MSKTDLKINWCSYRAAKHAVLNWHYSKKMPRFKLVKLGVWESGVFKGAVVFGRGASPHLLKQYGLKQTEGCELVRVALREHETPVTRILSIAIKMLKKQSPGVRLIVSFADPYRNHIGGIYQGGNWIYTGLTKPEKGYINNNGEMVHNRVVSSKGIVKMGTKYSRVPKPSDMKEILDLPGKHRYVYPLDSEMREVAEAMRKPYPKRCAGSIDGDASGNHPEEGGLSPTPALQNSY